MQFFLQTYTAIISIMSFVTSKIADTFFCKLCHNLSMIMTFVTSKTGPKILKRFGANLEILLHKLYCNHSIMCQNWKPQKDWLILINVLNRNRLQSDLCLTNSKIIFVFERKWQACPTKYVIVTMDEILVIICQRGWQGYFLTSSQIFAAVYQMGQGWFCRKEMIMVNFLATDQMQMKICPRGWQSF